MGSIVARLRTLPRPALGSTAGAAVTIVLRAGADSIETLLIERTRRNDDPASGQVALPGGHALPSDGGIVATALRELYEEVGIVATDLAESPRLFDVRHAARFGVEVAVVASTLSPSAADAAVHSVDEVANVFWFPRSALRRMLMLSVDTPYGPLATNGVPFEQWVVWGFTLRVLRDFFGWWDTGAPPPAGSASLAAGTAPERL